LTDHFLPSSIEKQGASAKFDRTISQLSFEKRKQLRNLIGLETELLTHETRNMAALGFSDSPDVLKLHFFSYTSKEGILFFDCPFEMLRGDACEEDCYVFEENYHGQVDESDRNPDKTEVEEWIADAENVTDFLEDMTLGRQKQMDNTTKKWAEARTEVMELKKQIEELKKELEMFEDVDPEEYEDFQNLANTYSDGSAVNLQYAIETMEEEKEELESKVEQYSDDADRCLEAEAENEKLEERIVSIRKEAEELNHEGWLKIATSDTEFKKLREKTKKQQEDIEKLEHSLRTTTSYWRDRTELIEKGIERLKLSFLEDTDDADDEDEE